MATWGMHLRIAEALLSQGFDFNEESFAVGNIAADCGELNDDKLTYTPDSNISHWSSGGKSNIKPQNFYEAHIENQVCDDYEMSFYYGYYAHLITDLLFTTKLFKDKVDHDKRYEKFKSDKLYLWKIKEDWYDLDHLYFRDHPDSLFHRVFSKIEEFPDYMDYYPIGAVSRRMKYITNYYSNVNNANGDLNRVFEFLTMEEMNEFVDYTVDYIKEAYEEIGIKPKKTASR